MGRRVKRKAVQSDDGWSLITHGVSGLSLQKGQKNEKEDGKEGDGKSLMPGILDGLTCDTLVADFTARQARWKDTDCAKHIDSLLRTRKWDVSQAVCIGIGSFSRDWEHRYRCMWQLILFVHVVEYLKQQNSPPIKLFAQDPAFTPLDISFLSRLDISVLQTNLETHIGPKTFVFSPFVDWFLLLPTFLRGKDPVLYIGNEVLDDYAPYAQTEEKRRALEECNVLGGRFLKDREVVRLREFGLHAHALNGMVGYWRKEGDGEDGERGGDT